MILKESDLLTLVNMLKANAPVRTGNLRNNGIAGIQIIPNGYLLQIGYPESVGGLPPTDEYAAKTELVNKTSRGWVERTIITWKREIEPQLKLRYERGVDYEF